MRAEHHKGCTITISVRGLRHAGAIDNLRERAWGVNHGNKYWRAVNSCQPSVGSRTRFFVIRAGTDTCTTALFGEEKMYGK